MTKMLLAAVGPIVAIVLSASAAQAQNWSGHHRADGFAGNPAFACDGFATRGVAIGVGSGDRHERRDRRDVRRVCNSDVVMDWYGGEWARWNNRSWEPTSYNDWWHENPSRAYPAWMRRNQDCSRQWFSGDTLRC